MGVWSPGCAVATAQVRVVRAQLLYDGFAVVAQPAWDPEEPLSPLLVAAAVAAAQKLPG
jgi:hypothetical protein